MRALLSGWQREWANGKRVVTEGRDQGTVVFYDAPCKIFLTASDSERAKRRCEELNGKGIQASFEDVLAQQQQRDREDTVRKVGGLKVADDATVVLTDGLTLEQVVDRLVEIVRSKALTAPHVISKRWRGGRESTMSEPIPTLNPTSRIQSQKNPTRMIKPRVVSLAVAINQRTSELPPAACHRGR